MVFDVEDFGKRCQSLSLCCTPERLQGQTSFFLPQWLSDPVQSVGEVSVMLDLIRSEFVSMPLLEQ